MTAGGQIDIGWWLVPVLREAWELCLTDAAVPNATAHDTRYRWRGIGACGRVCAELTSRLIRISERYVNEPTMNVESW